MDRHDEGEQMNVQDTSNYRQMKSLVIGKEFLDRQKRDRKYVIVHAAFLGLAIGGMSARRQFPHHEPGVIENSLFGLSMIGLIMLGPVLLRAIGDHVRTTKKLHRQTS